jgi:hypothetical protein
MTRTSLLAGAAGALVLLTPAPALAGRLDGTFVLEAGRSAGNGATGSYFRMAFPGGGGRYFKNPDSSARDKTYTPVRPGSAGGIVSGRFQQARGFDGQGNSRAAAIIRPTGFAGIRFGLATFPVDPQSRRKVAAPSFSNSGRRLTANLSAFTATWNKLFFNQGSPKPGSSRPLVSGVYNTRTRKFTLEWRSLIKGGAFNGFTGIWHLHGTFRPA